MATTAVFNGVNGKITVSGNVIGGCNTGEVTMTRAVAEFAEIGSNWMSIAAGQGTGNWSMQGAWAGSRWLPILMGQGSSWNIILENSGTNTADGATIIASGCLASEGTWTMNSGEISTDSLSGRCVEVYASGATYN